MREGTATLRIDGKEHWLESPRLVSQREAPEQLIPGSEPGDDFFRAEHYLVMEHADP